MNRICIKCRQERPLNEFYAGLTSCVDCHKEAVRLRRKTNPKVQEYDRERSKLPHRIKHNIENSRRWREKNPERYKANNAVNNAIRDGRLSRALACDGCGATERLHAHHDDYSKPLDVRWLCARCHHRGHHGSDT